MATKEVDKVDKKLKEELHSIIGQWRSAKGPEQAKLLKDIISMTANNPKVLSDEAMIFMAEVASWAIESKAGDPAEIKRSFKELYSSTEEYLSNGAKVKINEITRKAGFAV